MLLWGPTSTLTATTQLCRNSVVGPQSNKLLWCATVTRLGAVKPQCVCDAIWHACTNVTLRWGFPKARMILLCVLRSLQSMSSAQHREAAV